MNVNIYRGDLEACRVCLSTDIKLISLLDNHLKNIYSEFSGVPIMNPDNLPQHICIFCCALLKKCSKFRQKCKDSYTLLSGHLLEMHALTTSFIDTLDKSNLRLPLSSTNIIECHCIPEDTVKNESFEVVTLSTDNTPKPSDTDFDCFDDNSNIDVDTSYEEKYFKSEDEVPIIHLKTESADLDINRKQKQKYKLKTEKCRYQEDDKKQRQKYKLETAKELIIDDKDRIEDFKNKYCNKVMSSERESFYLHILEKYLKNNDVKTEIPAFISLDDDSKEDLKAKTKKDITIDINLENENQRRFYEHINHKYAKSNTSKVKQKKVKDIGRMKVKKIKRGNITKESLAQVSKDYNVDVVLLLKEEKIQDLLDRKETEKYKRSKYKCEVCYTGYAFEKTFQNHKAIHDPSYGPYECDICHVRFRCTKLWKRHVSAQHRYKLICRQCGQVLRSNTAAREHHQFHSGHSYICEHCGRIFDKYATRLNHVRIHHGSVSCDICHMKFTSEAGLVTHKTKAHKEMFKCGVCLVMFHNGIALQRHRDLTAARCGTHIKPCTQCGESCHDSASLTQHIVHQHGHENKRLKHMRQINTSFARRRREEGDAGPLTYMCEMCAKDDFKSEAALRYHQRKHSDERPVECDVCKKTFKDKYQLRIHMTIHTDERRFQCPLCPKAFRQQQHLTTHIRSHTNEKPYSCEVCDKQFKHKRSMQDHVRTVHDCLPPRKRIRHNTAV